MFIKNPHSALMGVAKDGRTPKVDVLAYITAGYVINREHLLVRPNQPPNTPGVVHKLLPEAATQAKIAPRLSIDHSNAGSRPATWLNLWNFLNSTGQSGEPHLQFSGPWATGDVDGQIAQFIPFNVRADCNFKANGWRHDGILWGAISHETADNGSATLKDTPWTAAQFTALVAATTAECVTYGIRCTVPTRWNDSGIGYHSQYREWSSFVGKTCPGAARIRQMDYLRAVVAQNIATYYNLVDGQCP